MSEPILPQLFDEEPASPWPWLLAIGAGIALLVLAWNQARAIPANLEQQAQSVAAQFEFRELSLSVSGRDLTVKGVLPVDANRTEVIEALQSIPGMRVVKSAIEIYDPKRAAENQLTRFREALDSIDTSSIRFEPGSTNFTTGSQSALEAVAELLLDNNTFRVRIAGHTDNTGRPVVNLRISRERAEAVLNWLQSRGVDANQMIAQGFGHTNPVADNATEAGRARNRRIEFTYID